MSNQAQEGDRPISHRQAGLGEEDETQRKAKRHVPPESDLSKSGLASTVRQALVHRLHRLEVVNKQLSDEKSQLENQLIHVLGRLANREGVHTVTSVGGQAKVSAHGGDSPTLMELIAQLRSSHVNRGEETKQPPLVRFGYPQRRSSLSDSTSFKLSTDYTSLSDTYEDICLNTDPVKALFSSGSETPRDIAIRVFDAARRSRRIFPAATPRDHDRRTDRGSERQTTLPAARSSSISDLSNLSFLNARPTQSVQHYLWQSSSGNNSTTYSSRSPSETSSGSSSFETFSRPNRRQVTSSGTSSPVWLVTAQDALRQRKHSNIRETKKQKTALPFPGRTTVQRLISDGISSQPGTKTTAEAVRQAPQASIGPPRVRITRRRIKSPVSLEDSSDATISLGCLVESKNTAISGRYPESKVSPSYCVNVGMRSEKGQLSTAAMVHMEYPPSGEHTRGKHDAKKRSEMTVGHYQDFLNTQIQFYRPPPSTMEALYENEDVTLIRLLSKMILGLDVFTCIKKKATLLLSVQPSQECFLPLLTRKNSASSHSQQSSELNSEWSPPTTDEQEVTQLSPESALTMTWMHTFGIQEKKTTDKSEDLTKLSGTQSSAVKTQNVKACSEKIDPNFVLHKDTLYRLRNHVKIWRKHFGFMSLSSLLLYTEEWPCRREASCCIQLCEIQTIRRSSSLSTSVAAGLTGSRQFQPDAGRPSEDKFFASSVPITRKFQPNYFQQAGPGRIPVDNFEVILHSGKTYRFRGETLADTNRWMLLIRRAFRAVRAREILQQRGAQLTIQGFLTRIKGGVASKVWCRLVGEYLIYSQTPDNSVPSGYRSLRDTYIRYMKHSPLVDRKHSTDCLHGSEHWGDDCFVSNSDSDSLTIGEMDSQQHRTLALWMVGSDPVYLICDSEDECQWWYCHLVKAGRSEQHGLDTPVDSHQAEELLHSHWRKLVRPEYVNNLLHSSLPLRSPIALSTDVNSSAEVSVKMFACLLFLSYPEIEYHPIGDVMTVGIQLPIITLLGSSQWQTMKYGVIKWLADCCLRNPRLKDELFLQLIKQASLTENQLVRWAKWEQVQRSERTDSPRRGLSILCGKPGFSKTSLRMRSTSFKGKTPVVSDPRHLHISSRQMAMLGDIADQLGTDANIILPAPAMSSQDRLHKGWPALAIWECLCLFLPLFLPSPPVLNCLKVLLRAQLLLESGKRVSDKTPAWFAELSLYAAFCREAITTTETRGGRLQKPSALEVTAISMRNPYTFTFPFSLPIHWVEGNAYEVVSFNGSSNFRYVVEHFIRKLGFHNNEQHRKAILGAIYMRVCRDGCSHKQYYHYYYLQPEWKICDVISLYEESILQHRGDTRKSVHLEETSVEFVFRVQAFSWRLLKKLEDVPEKKRILNLLCHQLHSDIVTGSYQIDFNGNELLNLVGLLCRVDHFDYGELQRQHQFTMDQILPSYFPSDWLERLRKDNQEIIKLKLLLLDRWMLISKTCASRNRPSTSRFDDPVVMVAEPDRITSKSLLDEIQLLEIMNACMTYLCYLRRLSPNRFGVSTFICRVDGLVGCSPDQLLYLVPQTDQLNFLVIKPMEEITRVPSNTFSSRRQSTQVTSLLVIPYREILSFGGQPNGSLFLVHTKSSGAAGVRQFAVGTRDNQAASVRGPSEMERRIYRSPIYSSNKKTSRQQELVLRKLHIYLKDLNALSELMDTLLYFINAE